MEREQVQSAIYNAFAELPVPNPRKILRRVDRRDRAGAEEFCRELAGKSWQSLPPDFLVRACDAFCYLSPEAYRYYLPSLLTGALQEFPEAGKLTSSVVHSLRPCFGTLYLKGKDADMRARQAIFTPSQYRAVCALLGLVFERLPSLRYHAAQALHWGWNQVDTPALEAANKYYHALRSFAYPLPKDPERVALCQEIYVAFAATPYPGDNKLCDSKQGDVDAEYAVELRGVKWQSAHPELLAHCDSALTLLTVSAFRYFLPAFLLADLVGYELGYKANSVPVFSLTYGIDDSYWEPVNLDSLTSLITPERGYSSVSRIPREEVRDMLREANDRKTMGQWRADHIRRFMPFSREERMAIIHYLEFRFRDASEAVKINQALERYWRPSLQSSVA